MEYYQIIKDMSNRFNYRLRMVEHACEHGISSAAQEYKTSRVTVRKWVRRYREEGLEGLKDRKRAPGHIPHKLKPEEEDRIVELRQNHPSWGSRRLIDRYQVKGSHGAVHRVIKQNNLIKPKKRRWRKRKDLSELKKRMEFFENSQIDTKDLSDIYHYWPFMRRLGLPRYEYTLRELSTGACFFAYADRNNSTYASLFARYVIEHLKSYGISTVGIYWQTDNGSEFIGSARKKIKRLSAFQKELKVSRIEHGRIPPRCPHLQGDVETFHRLVEDELYEIESYDNRIEFLGKVYAYQLYFNYLRKNRYRDNKSPAEILKERFPHTNQAVLNLPPLRLEILLESTCKKSYKSKRQGGYHVPIPVQKIRVFP
ncbi:MAG: transposase [Dehalococcoidia bacterium]|nr:MAG: transposase [Dehalococcoidia bacterium]